MALATVAPIREGAGDQAGGSQRSVLGWRRSASERSRSGFDEARVLVFGAFGLRARVKRVTDMSKGHVDEIEQGSVRASFRKAPSFPQFFGDLDQAIDFRHRHVLLMISAAVAPVCFPVSAIIRRIPIKPL